MSPTAKMWSGQGKYYLHFPDECLEIQQAAEQLLRVPKWNSRAKVLHVELWFQHRAFSIHGIISPSSDYAFSGRIKQLNPNPCLWWLLQNIHTMGWWVATDRERRLSSSSMGNTPDLLRLSAPSRLVLPVAVRALGVGCRRLGKTCTDREIPPKGSTDISDKWPCEIATQLRPPEI